MEQVLYSLPDGWKWLTLSETTLNAKADIVDGPFGSNLKASEYVNEGVPILRLQNVDRLSFINKNIQFITKEKAEQLSRHSYKVGDIVITKLGAPLGKACIVPDDFEDGRIVADIVRARINEDAFDKRYICYAINSSACVRQLESQTKGATRPRVNLSHMRGLILPVAPISEQKRIVEKLDALLTRIDTAIEYLQESVTLADALYASELNEVFPSDADIESLTDKDGWVSLSDICTFENGDRGKNYPSKSAFVAEGIPVVSAGNLGERYIDHKKLNYITPERYDLLRSGRIKIGDILFCLRGSLGKVAISKDIKEGVIASSLVIIRPKDRVSAEYIYKYLKSSLCQKFISYYNNGAAQPNLSAKSLGKFMLPLPNADQQKVIVDALDEKYQLNQKLLDGLNSKIISLQSLKASILDSAFKGEL
ncbi:MAG: restriction endonuclease subunit S [Venatoribacter sp.]